LHFAEYFEALQTSCLVQIGGHSADWGTLWEQIGLRLDICQNLSVSVVCSGLGRSGHPSAMSAANLDVAALCVPSNFLTPVEGSEDAGVLEAASV
jgi:D-arabinose 5-phosphate isomerase GutQ